MGILAKAAGITGAIIGVIVIDFVSLIADLILQLAILMAYGVIFYEVMEFISQFAGYNISSNTLIIIAALFAAVVYLAKFCKTLVVKAPRK